MKKNVILSNFQPIIIGTLFRQNQLNEYMKNIYLHYQKKSNLISMGDEDSSIEKEISKMVDKYAVSPDFISNRQILLFEEIKEVVNSNQMFYNENGMILPNNFENNESQQFGPKIESRMEWFKEKTKQVFDQFYKDKSLNGPENLVHVTCSGYSSPSVAQESVINNNWSKTQVTHSYQMGCYGAFPAIRTANGLMSSSNKKGRIDIVHTELLSAHLNLTESSPSNTMICSLFADGFIGYSMFDEDTFHNDTTITEKKGLKIISSHEVIIPNSLEDMSWDLGEYNFLMTLSKRVPVFIRQNIKSFIIELCNKGNIDFEIEKFKMHFAIHPGGPKIIDYVVEELDIFKEQSRWSYDILKRQGNMSSATIPHIFNEIVNDSTIKKGTKIIAMAFGPGLTATSLLLEKI